MTWDAISVILNLILTTKLHLAITPDFHIVEGYLSGGNIADISWWSTQKQTTLQNHFKKYKNQNIKIHAFANNQEQNIYLFLIFCLFATFGFATENTVQKRQALWMDFCTLTKFLGQGLLIRLLFIL